jgi:hypothetical protein
MNTRILLLLLGLISAGLAGNSLFTPVLANDYTANLLSLQDPTNPQKVTICHIPPGEPQNRHTITIGAGAVAAHVRNHGDYIGACQPVLPP